MFLPCTKFFDLDKSILQVDTMQRHVFPSEPFLNLKVYAEIVRTVRSSRRGKIQTLTPRESQNLLIGKATILTPVGGLGHNNCQERSALNENALLYLMRSMRSENCL